MAINKKFRIAVDSNIIIYLAKFNNPAYDPDNIVHDLISKNALNPSLFEKTPRRSLPLLLKDKYLGEIKEKEFGVGGWLSIYENLCNIAQLFNYIKRGIIEICATPTVYYEVDNHSNHEFLAKYVTKLDVSKEDSAEFYGKRWLLATKYSEAGVIKKKRDAVTLKDRIIADACIVAEASLFGLNLISANEIDVIHRIPENRDFEISTGIRDINNEQGLIFTDDRGNKRSPSTFAVESIITRLKQLNKGNRMTYTLDYEDANIDIHNMFISH